MSKCCGIFVVLILFNLAFFGGLTGFILSLNNKKEYLEKNCYFIAKNCIDGNTEKYEKIVRNRIKYESGNGENETKPELCDMTNTKSDMSLEMCREDIDQKYIFIISFIMAYLVIAIPTQAIAVNYVVQN